jgi:hypothetical protein
VVEAEHRGQVQQIQAVGADFLELALGGRNLMIKEISVTENTGPEAGQIDGRSPEIPEIEVAYRTAHRALEGIIAAQAGHMDFAPEAGLHRDQVLSQFPLMIREAEIAAWPTRVR